ncbi:MAG: hypothetical protein AB1938_18215 [Myxococcota bacterium]
MNPLAPSPARRLELTRSTSFKDEKDGGRLLELSMAVTLFKKLQDARLISASAKLADRLPEVPGLKGKTWEARLVELIQDADANGQLDVDLAALASSLPLKGKPTAADLESILAGRSAAPLPDAFLASQRDDSHLAKWRALTPKGAAVQAYSFGMRLTGEQDRATLAFVEEALAVLDRDPSSSRTIANSAIGGAQLLTTSGQAVRARELLDATADTLVAHGRFEDARRVLTTLTQPPHAAVRKNLVQDAIDQAKAVKPDYDERTGLPIPCQTPAGNVLQLKPRNYESTVGEAAVARLIQVDVRARMSAVLGRNVNPYSMEDVGAYLRAFSKGRDASAVAHAYGEYLAAFYKHAGEGVEWTSAIPSDERAARLDELFDGQPFDDAGRRIVDCEGFAYLTHRLLGGITTADGARRFEVQYATRPGHVITGVLEVGSQQLFTVNNEAVSKPAVTKSVLAQQELIARELCGKYPNIIAIAGAQSASQPSETTAARLAPPKPGALIWNGAQVSGVVTEDTRARYAEYAQRVLSPSYNEFLVSGGR